VSGPTSGKTPAGAPIVVTLRGANFGFSGSVLFTPTIPSELATLGVFTVPPANVVSWNHTTIVFAMPEGAGTALLVTVVAGGQASTSGAAFAYDPPVVTSFKAVADASGTSKVCGFYTTDVGAVDNNGTRVLVQRQYDCYNTRGGDVIQITGTSFGTRAATVLINGLFATVISLDHNVIYAYSPQSIGASVPLTVTVGGRTSPVTPATRFAYDRPVLQRVSSPAGGPSVDATCAPAAVTSADGLTTTTACTTSADMKGVKFGYVPGVTTAVAIGGVPCRTTTWGNDNTINCQIGAASTVGYKNITILAANQTAPSFYSEFEVGTVIQFICPYNHYGLIDELCVNCPLRQQGALCPGNTFDRTWDRVVSLPGFFRINFTDAPQCMPENLGRLKLGLGCPRYLACEPPESCLGANVCAEGYTGDRCSLCIVPGYHRVNGKCEKCPNSPKESQRGRLAERAGWAQISHPHGRLERAAG
jgi:hypothetical protein